MIDVSKINIVKEFKDELISSGINIDKIIIFGSQVKGTANKWSDLDVCVVSPIFGHDRLSERVMLAKIGHKVSDDIEPHPMNLSELNDKFNPLANEIRNYGVEV